MSKRELIQLDWPEYRKATYSAAVKKGKMLFLSGVGPQDPVTGKVVGLNDLEAQSRQIYKNIEAHLAAAGATFDDVVKTTDYILPEALPNWRLTAKVRREYFKNGFPAATGVVVHRLTYTGMLMEVDVIAVLD